MMDREACNLANEVVGEVNILNNYFQHEFPNLC